MYGEIQFHNDDPMLKYCQKSLIICCFCILASDISSIKKPRLPMLYNCACKNPWRVKWLIVLILQMLF